MGTAHSLPIVGRADRRANLRTYSQALAMWDNLPEGPLTSWGGSPRTRIIMANDELWRWAEPDGKQREVTLEELRIAFSRGILVTNTPVWRKGFSDWRPAVEVTELKASVLSGARVPTPKGASFPGKSVAQRGGAAATEEEPPSPPVYTPTAKPLPGRPSAPSLELKGSEGEGEAPVRRPTMPIPSGQAGAEGGAGRSDAPRERAATLIIHAGAPPAQEQASSATGAPIVVPSAEPDKAPRTITQPPPVMDDAAAVVPAAPETAKAPSIEAAPTPAAPPVAQAPVPAKAEPKVEAASGTAAAANAPSPETPRVPVLDLSSSKKLAAAQSAAPDHSPESAPTREVPAEKPSDSDLAATQERRLNPAAAMAAAAAKMAADSTAKLPALADAVPAAVSTSMILSDSSAKLPDSSGAFEPVSTASLLEDVESSPESVEPASTEELSTDDLMPASNQSPPVRQHSMPPPLEKTVSMPPRLDKTVSMRPRQPSIPPPIPVSAQEAADRMGMGRLPPPDISLEEERAQRAAATLPPGAEGASGGIPAGVPWVGVIIALASVGFGAYYMGRAGGEKPVVPPPAVIVTTVPVATAVPSAVASAPETPKELRCKLSANARSLAPKTVVSVGIDVAAGPDGYAVGYATSPRDAVAVRLDGSSFAPLDMVRGKAPSDLRRVVPILADKIAVLGEIDTPVSGVTKRRLARGSSAYVGLAKDHFVWGKSDSAPPDQLLTMSAAKVEALRATAFTEGNVAFAYRSDGAIWVGTSQSGDVPQRFAGLGGGVGSPALAAVGNSVLVVWADRKSADDPWVLRIGEHRPGSAPPEPRTFESTGGLGGARLSPALSSAGDDRALLVWTDEGSRGGDIVHEVRGQLVDKKGSSIGAAFSVSMPDMNAGQPQVALAPGGSDKGLRGIASFLVATENGFEVAGAPLSCVRE